MVLLDKFKSISKKIPYSLLGFMCVGFTYFVAGTIGMLVLPVILCVIFVLPFGILFAILDIVIRKKKLFPIICLVECAFPFIGVVFMLTGLIAGAW